MQLCHFESRELFDFHFVSARDALIAQLFRARCEGSGGALDQLIPEMVPALDETSTYDIRHVAFGDKDIHKAHNADRPKHDNLTPHSGTAIWNH